MKNRGKQKTGKKATQSSMSNASEPICQEEECIGKVAATNPDDASERGRDKEKNRMSTTRSSMNFGKKGTCSDKECIGET